MMNTGRPQRRGSFSSPRIEKDSRQTNTEKPSGQAARTGLPRHAASSGEAPPRSVFIVEDPKEESVSGPLRCVAERLGYSVAGECSNPAEAVTSLVGLDVGVVLTRHPDPVLLQAAPSIVLSDSNMASLAGLHDAFQAQAAGYLVSPKSPSCDICLSAAIEMVLNQTREIARLRKELAEAQEALAARKTIERTKGIMMEREGLTENEAFARLRRLSMDERMSMKDLCGTLLQAWEAETDRAEEPASGGRPQSRDRSGGPSPRQRKS